MSLAFRITNNFQDNTESNALKKAKMEDGQARATQQGQKRAALGTITNNAGLRIQPFRAAKQQVSETLSISLQNFQSFKLRVRFVSLLEKPFSLLNFSFRITVGWLDWFFVSLRSCQERRECIQSCTTKDRLRCTDNCTAKFHHTRRPRTSSRPKYSIYHEFHSTRTEPGVNNPFTTCFNKCVCRKQSRGRR